MSYTVYRFVTIVVLVSVHFSGSSKPTSIKFPKDQSLSIVFPVKIKLPAGPGLPIGHLRPLGHQRRSNGEVTTGDISKWNTDTSLLFRGLVDAQTIWSQLGKDTNKTSMNVLVTKRSNNAASRYESMDLVTFLENYGSEEWLLDYILSKELIDDIGKIPKGFECLSEKLLYTSSSLTSGIASDDIKVSPHHKLQCVLSGRRDYIIMQKSSTTPIFPPNNSQILCEMEEIVDLNPDLVNLFDDSWILQMTWQHATLKSGDCILLPADSMMHSTSYGPVCETMTFNWHSRFNNGTCKKKPEVEKLAPLLCSTRSNQKPQLCDHKKMDKEERWRELLSQFVNKDGVLTESCFSKLVKDEATGKEIFKMFGKGSVNEETITKLTRSTLKKMLNFSSKHQHVHDEL